MTINIHTPSTLVKFYALEPGDVFRYEINGAGHYFMKTVTTKSGCNCVDFTDSTLGHMDESDCVYKAKSANLSIIF